jgi:hypothetical protein
MAPVQENKSADAHDAALATSNAASFETTRLFMEILPKRLRFTDSNARGFM